MCILKYAMCVVVAALAGGAIVWTVCVNHGEQRAVIVKSDNSESLNDAINAYQKWCVDEARFSPQLPGAETPGFVRIYLERQQKRFSVLTAEFERYLIPEAGSGGPNVKYLYDLSKTQEQTIARWLDADAAGQSAALPDIMRQITVNDGSLERTIELFKLMLGREDHNLKNIQVIYRKNN